MRELDKTEIYDLSELNNKELQQVLDFLCTEDEQWLKITFKNFSEGLENVRLTYGDHGWMWVGQEPTANAKELFYTLENVQVDCRELTEGQVKEMVSIFENNGYKQWIDPEAFIIIDNFTYLRIDSENEFYITGGLDTKTTITYEKFIELFAPQPKHPLTPVIEKAKEISKNINKAKVFKDLVEVLNEELTEEYNNSQFKQIGIDTFNPQEHYNNEIKQFRSLFELSNVLGLNEWEFDILKRLVRCRKKGQFKQDIQKIKDTVDIYLNEYSE